MAYDLRYPMITGASEKEQLTQMKSYLHQLVEQLNYSLNNIDKVQVQYVNAPIKAETSTKSEDKGTQATFDDIKSLIIKSADIVEAYYEKISERLEGVYVAQSEFGTFTEKTIQDIYTTSTEIEQFFTNLQKVTTDIKNINFALAEVNACIKAGLLYNDDNGVPVYGLEIGQTNTIDGVETFNKYARFTSDRLSFYDRNNIEVAYISDYKIHITHAEVTGTLKLGGYLVDTTKGVAFKWVGRS